MKLITLLQEIDCDVTIEICNHTPDMIISGSVTDVVDWMYQTKSDKLDILTY